jgi:hypothetical protein
MNDGRGRPPADNPPRIYRTTLRLYPGEDDDLIDYLDHAPPRGLNAAIIAAMRSGNLHTTNEVLEDENILDDLADFLI